MNPFPTVNARGAALAHVCAVAIEEAEKNPPQKFSGLPDESIVEGEDFPSFLQKREPTFVHVLVPTDEWWAQRWIDKATPGERAAMRRLIMDASDE